MGIDVQEDAREISTGECVKKPSDRTSSTPLVVGFTVVSIVVYLVDTATIQERTVEDVVRETLTIACCVLVLPILLRSLKKFMPERVPSPSSVRRTPRTGKVPNDTRCWDGSSDVSDVPVTYAGTGQETNIVSGRSDDANIPSTHAGTGEETIIDSRRSDVSDVPSTYAGTGQETIIDSQQSAGMVQFMHALDTAAKAADPHQAEKLFAEMQRAGFQLSVLVYNSVIQACANKGEVSRAEKWLRQMKADGVEPNVVTYTMLMEMRKKWFIKMYEDGIDFDL